MFGVCIYSLGRVLALLHTEQEYVKPRPKEAIQKNKLKMHIPDTTVPSGNPAAK